MLSIQQRLVSVLRNIRKISNSTTNKLLTKYIKRRKRGKKDAQTSKGSYPPNLPLIEEAPGREPSGLRI
jgi:ribosomal protein S19E (S16A)